jgi:hypothetical protein
MRPFWHRKSYPTDLSSLSLNLRQIPVIKSKVGPNGVAELNPSTESSKLAKSPLQHPVLEKRQADTRIAILPAPNKTEFH